MNKEVPEYASHADVVCFNCDRPLTESEEGHVGFPTEQWLGWQKYCDSCHMVTFYELKED